MFRLFSDMLYSNSSCSSSVSLWSCMVVELWCCRVEGGTRLQTCYLQGVEMLNCTFKGFFACLQTGSPNNAVSSFDEPVNDSKLRLISALLVILDYYVSNLWVARLFSSRSTVTLLKTSDLFGCPSSPYDFLALE